jgi:hypothetical protein
MNEKSFADSEAFFICPALSDRFPTASVFEPAASAVAVLLSLLTRRIDRRFEPIDDEALVIGQLVPMFHHRKAAAGTGVHVFGDLHGVFAFTRLQFNILGQY